MRAAVILTATLALAACGPHSAPQDSVAHAASSSDSASSGLGARLEKAMADPRRSAADRALDATRKPVAVLEFFDIRPGMTVLDVNAADGYYTELLSAAVGPRGKVYAQNDAAALARDHGAVEHALASRLANYRLPNVLRLDEDLGELKLSESVDAALLVLTLHDLYNLRGEDATVELLRDIRDALRPGAVLGVVDHVGEASRSLDAGSLHRIEKNVAERLLTAAGFTIEAESDVLANPDDKHDRSVFDPSIRRRTDRFVIRARK
jgi:predicted methyltransferase